MNALPQFPAHPASAPVALRSRAQWVAWKYEYQNGPDKKPTKPPISPHTGYRASHSKPADWGTFEKACDRMERDRLAGVGYVLTADDNICGIDLDNCRDPETGILEPWALDLVTMGETYTEVSPSGKGLRLFAYGKPERVTNCGGIEIYGSKRYLTVTGNHLANTPREINPAPRTIAALMARVGKQKESATPELPKGDFFSSVNTAALARLSQWVPALLPLARLQSGTGAYRVSSRDLGRDLEEDLSISPDGIVDFGVADMGDPRDGKRSAIDLVKEHSGCDTKAAAFWLCDRMGIPARDLGWNEVKMPPIDYAALPPGALPHPPAAPSLALPPSAPPFQPAVVASKAVLPVFLNAAALMDMDFAPIRYVVPGYFAEGLTLFAGRPKLGKSWFMLDVALGVASGGVTLGGVQCDQGDVLYLALEDNARRLQSRLRRVLQLETLAKQPVPPSLTFVTEWPRANQGGIDQLRKWLTEHPNARMVIIDVLAMFKAMGTGKDQTNYEADYLAVKELQALASEMGVAIIVVHHTRKSAAEVDPFEKVSGTMGLSGAADTVMILDRDGNGATLYGRGRDIEEIETAVQFDKQTCRWVALGNAQEVRRTDERKETLQLFLTADAPMSPKDVSLALGKDPNTIHALLHRMHKSNEINKVRRGLYVHPERSEILKSSTPRTPCKESKEVRKSWLDGINELQCKNTNLTPPTVPPVRIESLPTPLNVMQRKDKGENDEN